MSSTSTKTPGYNALVPASQRIHIGFFGRTNAGKSSLVNAIANQSLSVVSEQAGTTTDPVRKAMELLPLGPVILIDTPGLADSSALGTLREEKTRQILRSIDVGVLVLSADENGMLAPCEQSVLTFFEQQHIPYLICINKQDLHPQNTAFFNPGSPLSPYRERILTVSARTREGIEELKERLARLPGAEEQPVFFISDRLQPLDSVILVIPIDSGAPKGRIILPQQQVLRELLEGGMLTTVVRETELKAALCRVQPRVVITDSQAFHQVAPLVPESVYLTSFSILMARYKGTLAAAVEGACALDTLPQGAHILISEGCTHHRQCDDIGTKKLPRWIQEYTNRTFSFSFTSGREFPDDLSGYQLVVHCGGCMLHSREVQYRYAHARDCGIPVTNYGILIAHIRGILERSIAILNG